MGKSDANLEEKKLELSNRIELRLRFEELRGKLNVWGEGKFWKANEEANRQEVARNSPTIVEEGEAESVSEKVHHAASLRNGIGDFGKCWGPCGRGNLSGNRDTGERFSGNSELGRG